MTKTVLSPVALSVRDQAVPAARAADLDRIRSVCLEMLEANTTDIPLGSAEMKATVASVVQGVLAALGSSRAEVVEVTMHTIARFASTRQGSDPNVVAAVICDAASVIEISEDERQPYLDSLIEAALSACDHLLGPEREELAAFLRSALPVFLQQRTNGHSDEPAHSEPNVSRHLP